MTEAFIPYLFNVLLGVVMYFLKASNDSLQTRLTKLETQVDHLKDSTVKTTDFRDFKDELWNRFDKMENTFERRIREMG